MKSIRDIEMLKYQEVRSFKHFVLFFDNSFYELPIDEKIVLIDIYVEIAIKYQNFEKAQTPLFNSIHLMMNKMKNHYE